MATRPVLTYFDLRGRAEPTRLLLVDQGVDYEDKLIPMDQAWQEIKPQMIFGKLPSLNDGDLELVESMAILRHFGRKLDLYGSTENERAKADMLTDAFLELFINFATSVYTEYADGCKKFLSGLNDSLQRFESQLKKSAGSYCLLDKPLFVDYMALHVLDSVLAVKSDALDSFPTLAAFYKTMMNRPNIKKYREKPEIKARPYTGSGNL